MNFSLPKQASIGQKELVFLMAMLQALQALAIDIMLPALGVMADDLGAVSDNQRQLVVGLFLLGAGVGSLVPGSISDRFGRRPVLITALLFYIISSIACAFAQNFNQLLVLRVIQAVGSGALMVMPSAIIRDRFEGDRMAKVQSMIAVIFLTIPMLAPSLGQVILLVANWHWIFGVMGLMGTITLAWLYLRLPETLLPENRQPIKLRPIAHNMGQVVVTRSAIGYVIASAMMIGVIWGYINSSQQLIAEHFGAGVLFPIIFGGLALAIAAANMVNARIVEKYGARRVSQVALLSYIVMACIHVCLATFSEETLWPFVAAFAVSMFLSGFCGANFMSIALQPFGRTAGAAASVQSFMRTVIGALMGAGIGQAFDGSARALSWSMLIGGGIALLCVLFSERGRLFQRSQPA